MPLQTQNNDYRRRVGDAAQTTLDALSSVSRISRPQHIDVPQVSWEDVHEQTTVGIGGFCRVNQVHISNPTFNDKLLALKRLKSGLMKPQEEKTCASAAADLVAEGLILSKLNHENIIKLHGVCKGGPEHAFTENDRGYFLVLDLLEDTLSTKLAKYRLLSKSRGGPFGFRSRKHTSPSAVASRLEGIAIGVAKGLTYLHQNNVVLRDLKPDNIGFDFYGMPKVFDLGLARELHMVPKKEVAGTLRYLAPEAATGHGFEKASDVYSFGLLLWELCTLEKPFKKIKTSEAFMETVVFGQYRPSLSGIKSSSLRKLIQDCWAHRASDRPSMSEVLGRLVLFTSLKTRRRAGWRFDRTAKHSNTTTVVESDLTSISFSGPIEMHKHSELSEVSRDATSTNGISAATKQGVTKHPCRVKSMSATTPTRPTRKG